MQNEQIRNIPDAELADILIDRLNLIINDPEVRKDVGRLLETRIECSKATVDHPTIQALRQESGAYVLGWLGILNGIVGVLPDGWGYVTAVINDDGTLEKFCRTDVAP